MALICIDRQHVGHPGRNFLDVGAWCDADRNGKRDVVELEGIMTAIYGLALEIRLRERGHTVIWISDGSYAERWARVKKYRADIYIALHCNAGKGSYGLVVYDHRSKRGPVLAAEVATALKKACPELDSVKADPTDGVSKWPRAWNCIHGVQDGTPTALLLEPFFVDQPKHVELMTRSGLERVGIAAADGIHAYCRGVGLAA